MPEPESNFEVCRAALAQGQMPPVENWCRLKEAAQNYFLLQTLLRLLKPPALVEVPEELILRKTPGANCFVKKGARAKKPAATD